MLIVVKKIVGFYLNILGVIAPSTAGRQAFYLFCIPFKAQLNEKQQKYLSSGNPDEILVEGIPVKLYKWGSGDEKILFVHGWRSNSYRWKRYIDALDKTKYTAYAFDAPGHGNSGSLYGNVPLYEKSVRAIVKNLGKVDAIIGHSIGSFASSYFLYENEMKVERFVSLAPPYAASDFVDYYKSELSLTSRTTRYLENYFKEYAGQEVEYFSLERFSPKLNIKSLLIHDRGDKDTKVDNSIRMHRDMPNSELFVTEGLGHTLRSKKVVNKIVEFLEN